MKDTDSNLKYNNRAQDLNGFEEVVEFLPATNSKKVEKATLKQKLTIAGVVIGAALLALTIGLLVWHFGYRSKPVQKVYNGFLRVTNYAFIDAYENPSSPEFAELSTKVMDMLQSTYQGHPDLGPYFKQCNVTAFSEGSVIAYYWTEFSVPAYREEAMEKAMNDLKVENVNLRQRSSLYVDSFVAYPADLEMARNFRKSRCSFSLHTVPGAITKFSTPGFPNSPYPPNAQCQWLLRADANHVIILNFKTFKMEPCKTTMGDYVKVYDSLTPVEPKAMVRLCGSYPPSYNLTFISSQNVVLVTLVTDDRGKHPGFRAEFSQLPKTSLCGGYFREESGVITTPYYPAHYPPNMECTWDIQVPVDKFVKVRFNMFFLGAEVVPSCPNDYVEINNQRYCGELKTFVVSSNSSRIVVRFRSDQSYTDTGFTAQYISYEPKNPCPDQYTCKSGRCIATALKCDGWNDCGDFSDETTCVCTKDQFRCTKSQLCKPGYFTCDGVNDCGDNSDELNCKCPDTDFKCGNGKCIPLSKKCDGADTCGDGSDESECGKAQVTTCTAFTYKCRNNQCITKKNPECDGENDCSDGSDEDATTTCNCGKRPYSRKTRIVGGVNADIGEWPWQVSLHTKRDRHTCGASLVSPTILISAAHCFQDMQGIRYSDPSIWTAYLGLHDQAQLKAKDVVERKIKRIVAHTKFSDYTYDNDIAMLELESPVTYTDFIQPICIPDSSHDFPAGKSIWVTGWGAMSEGGTGAIILQKAEIRIINQTECNKYLDDQLTERMLCAGFLTGGIDACQGDSGGPLSSVEINGKVYLAGVVSWGEGCARRNKPGIYTRVTMMRDWIKQNTGL
ncbi:suppressor of tumorigenicity 14 protein [Discoglossus pictus]